MKPKSPEEIAKQILAANGENYFGLRTDIQAAIQAERDRAQELVDALDRVNKGLNEGISTVPNSYAHDQCSRSLAQYRGDE